jgi:hypothetical protein
MVAAHGFFDAHGRIHAAMVIANGQPDGFFYGVAGIFRRDADEGGIALDIPMLPMPHDMVLGRRSRFNFGTMGHQLPILPAWRRT